MRWTGLIACLVMALSQMSGHEGGQGKARRATRAGKDLKTARDQMDIARKKLTEQGRYACCVRPGCSLCAHVSGSCSCAANAGKGGVCGECLAGWKAGRGAVKGVPASAIRLMPADKQACHGVGSPLPELEAANKAILAAKRTLVAEKSFSCCIRGGCYQCAHEADCPCGSDLASAKPKGVCGDCVDGWHSGLGAFSGVPLSDVMLAPMLAGGSMMLSSGSGQLSSGTSQVPGQSPLDMFNARLGGWNLMFHGVFFGVHTNHSGPRGRDKFFSTNWIMPAASRRVGPGTLTVRAMLSLEPATVTNRRYPLLFQRGETAYGVPIINGQHPHDFFMELGALYQARLGERTLVHFYGGPRGEPALGAAAFPHRVSSSENPIAVLGHHFQDSTHISNNVVTAGITHRAFTLEASGFHGREPDEQPWGLERGGIDSFSTRLTVSPTPRWSGQVSVGRINNREVTHPVRDTLRTSASVMYVRPLALGHWATSVIWGRNVDLEFTQPPALGAGLVIPQSSKDNRRFHRVPFPTRIPREIYNSYLAESTLHFRGRNWLWGRVEHADRDSLLLYEEAPFVILAEERRFARVQSYTAGYLRDLPMPASWLRTGIGAQFTLYGTPEILRPIYGAHPAGVQLFLRLRLRTPQP